MFYHKDPRRIQPLFDHIFESFRKMDFNAELSFDAVKDISLFRAVFEELSRKFLAWTDETVDRVWTEINCEHDDACFLLPFLFSPLIDVFRFEVISAKSCVSQKT